MTGKLCWLNTDGEHLCEVAILGQDSRLPWQAAKVCRMTNVMRPYLEATA